MRDDFLSGDWAANSPRFAADINKLGHDLVTRLGETFSALHRAQFDAPWRRPTRRVRIVGLR